MRKSVKVLLIFLAIIITLFIITIAYYLIVTSGVRLDENKLINLENTITFFDCENEPLCEESSNITVTNIEEIPEHVKNAFIAIEDKRFYNHKGIDYKSIGRALLNNLKSFSLKEGASTISQQLIKNTHLSSEKTLDRKFKEYKLVKELEKKYSKDEILEKYLNTIYFGNNCYGITQASKKFFDKTPSELTLNEGAILAGIIKAPTSYSPINHEEKCFKRKQLVLKEMLNQNLIDIAQYNHSVDEKITIKESINKKYSALYLAEKEFSKIFENTLNNNIKYKVFTTIDSKIQNIIDEDSKKLENDKTVLVMGKDASIKAYSSTCGEIKRPMGSAIKPLLVYAPAIENDVIAPYSILNDEKTNFNGYSPSNYANKYYGNISAKHSLAVSSNVCAVKILNSTGIEKSLDYFKKMNFEITESDNSLCMALGVTKKGATLTELTAGYSTFINSGTYSASYIISKIEDEYGNIVYKNNNKKNKVFSEETSYLMNDMLNETVKNGTAKKLSFANGNLCGKTGTVGNKNGNTDAYSISYNTDYLVSVWYGNADNTLMDNSITGGGAPSVEALKIWNDIYNNSTYPDAYFTSNKVKKIKLDKISYDSGKIELSDVIAPERYTFEVPAKLYTNLPLSTRFSVPKVKKPILSINNKRISIQLCQTDLYNYIIKKEVNGIPKNIIDTINLENKNLYIDDSNTYGDVILYKVIPYFATDNKRYYGKEIVLDKIKISPINKEDNWWDDDF